jgi:phytoene dehydrogenase-like protein
MAKQAIIVGGGHNGLVCACYLAKAGLKVTILERRPIIGGAAVTEEFHPGFRNSIASYTVSLLHPKVIKDLNLHAHGLKILERPVNNFLPLPNDDSLTSFIDPHEMRREVARFSATDADNLSNFYDSLGSSASVIRELMLEIPPTLEHAGIADLWQLFRLSRTFSRLSTEEKRQLIRIFSVSAGEILDDEFESDPLKALIGFDSIVGSYASPYQAGSGYVLLHHVLGEVNGKAGRWGHAVGGMGSITQAMANEAQALGVEIQTNTAVERIHTKNGRVIAIETDDHQSINAELVVSNLNPKLLYLDLLAPADISPETRRHFERYKCQSGSFRMNVALSALPQFTADTPVDALTGGIIIAPSLGYMDKAYRDATDHGFSRQPVVELLIPSLLDDSLAPPGQHVASLFCQQFDPALGRGWDTRKTEAAATIINTVNQYAPNFRDSIIGQQVISPFDLESIFGLVGGDIFHGRLSVEQLFSARPMLGAGQYATEIKGLYMCGSGTHPGGGVSGIPGHNAAKKIVSDL